MPYVAYENGCKGNAIVTLARRLCRGLREDYFDRKPEGRGSGLTMIQAVGLIGSKNR
jgi:hypothetical protein